MKYSKVVLVGMFAAILMVVTLFSNNFNVEAQGIELERENQDLHCSFLLEPAAEGETESRVTEIGCFDTEEERDASLVDYGLVSPTHEPDSDKGPEAPQASSVIAQVFTGPNYTGGSALIYDPTDYDGCRDNGRFYLSSLSSYWNDKISSARTYSGCRMNLYRFSGYWGESLTCNQGYETCRMMGWMGNRTSSIYIYK